MTGSGEGDGEMGVRCSAQGGSRKLSLLTFGQMVGQAQQCTLVTNMEGNTRKLGVLEDSRRGNISWQLELSFLCLWPYHDICGLALWINPLQ